MQLRIWLNIVSRSAPGFSHLVDERTDLLSRPRSATANCPAQSYGRWHGPDARLVFIAGLLLKPSLQIDFLVVIRHFVLIRISILN